MRANPGGTIAPTELIGRSELIEQCWRVLDTRSIQLLADRRYGKSSVIRAMHARPPKGWLSVLQDLEGVRTPLEFVDAVHQQAEQHLSLRRRTTGKLSSLVRGLTGAELLHTRLPDQLGQDWKRLLVAVFEDLEENLDSRLVFLWDEVPYMLQNVRDTAGEDTAREILDTLRAIRQQSRRTRMVFTGSIGLHHVVRSLSQEQPTAHAPLNDMTPIDVPPIARQDAVDLALRLIRGEKMVSRDPDAAAHALAEASGDLPYYIHYAIDALVQQGQPAELETVRECISSAIRAAHDPLNLQHYDRRLRAYYGDREELARAALDLIAAEQPLPRADVVARCVAGGHADSSAEAIQMLAHLAADHYLLSDTEDRLRFNNDIVRRWWRHARMV